MKQWRKKSSLEESMHWLQPKHYFTREGSQGQIKQNWFYAKCLVITDTDDENMQEIV